MTKCILAGHKAKSKFQPYTENDFEWKEGGKINVIAMMRIW